MKSDRHSGPKSHVTDRTSYTLLERLRESDDKAWQRLVDLYSPLVFSWCRRCDLSSEDASDCLQEVFATVARRIGAFRREQAGHTFRGWLRTITRNQIRLHFRKNKNHPAAVGGSTVHVRIQDVPDDALDEPAETVGSEVNRLYRRALELIRAEFEEHTWKAFYETTVNQRASPDVAADLNMTPAAVRNAKYKVLRKLRADLDEIVR